MQSDVETIESNTLHQLFKNSADVQFQEYTFQQHKVMFITCDAMIDQHLLNDVIVKRVQLLCENVVDKSMEEAMFAQLHIPDLIKVEDKAEAISLYIQGICYFILMLKTYYFRAILRKNRIGILKRREWKF